jgi:hypothetical protein
MLGKNMNKNNKARRQLIKFLAASLVFAGFSAARPWHWALMLFVLAGPICGALRLSDSPG